jgi:hypothetical protein
LGIWFIISRHEGPLLFSITGPSLSLH